MSSCTKQTPAVLAAIRAAADGRRRRTVPRTLAGYDRTDEEREILTAHLDDTVADSGRVDGLRHGLATRRLRASARSLRSHPTGRPRGVGTTGTTVTAAHTSPVG